MTFQGGGQQKSLWETGALPGDKKGEARRVTREGTESPGAGHGDESRTGTAMLMEEVVARGNMVAALKRVQANKGSSGVDGITVERLPEYLRQHWEEIRERLLGGGYRPQPVKRVQIPKPDGGVRDLGVPTVVDRLIQQAVMQVLQSRWDGTFSEHSYGFRPGRSAHQGVAKAQEYIRAGYGWVVDIDLEKFFDRVNHDRLMSRIAERVEDKRLLKLIRAFLEAGVMVGGLVSPTEEGVPQGGPLSPLLSNLVLDELDRELERRGHRFVRYADDCNIYVRSPRAGERVMESISAYLGKKLKLKVNTQKSAVARPKDRKFLGFSFTAGSTPKRRIAPKALARCKRRIRELTRRSRGVSLQRMVDDLRPYLNGWIAYFGYCQTPSVLQELDSWMRRRLRSKAWKEWKRGTTRYRELRSRGVSHDLAARTVWWNRGPWATSRSLALSYALPNAYLASLGLPVLEHRVHV